MTTAQEVESTIDECNTAPVVNKYLRQYAEMIQKYADAVAENVRLREAINKYSEDEMLLIEQRLSIAVTALRKIEINDDCYESAPIAREALAQIEEEK